LASFQSPGRRGRLETLAPSVVRSAIVSTLMTLLHRATALGEMSWASPLHMAPVWPTSPLPAVSIATSNLPTSSSNGEGHSPVATSGVRTSDTSPATRCSATVNGPVPPSALRASFLRVTSFAYLMLSFADTIFADSTCRFVDEREQRARREDRGWQARRDRRIWW
jgi:hypothetical protein